MSAPDPEALERCRITYLGRKSELSGKLRSIAALPAEERRAAGQELNRLKREIEESLASRSVAISSGREQREDFDATFPGRETARGGMHPISFVMRDAVEIFRGLGFEHVRGSECEDDYYNFTALNTPEDHPARDMQATYFLEGGGVLRTQTSSVWAHVMERRPPPLRIVCPGRVFRRDWADATHSPVFHQIEGLWVDELCRFSDLKGVLEAFLKEFFGAETRVRFDPRFFPFTEPSAEVSVECRVCRGSGCASCGRSGWLELLGAGMVHPNILAGVRGEFGARYAADGIRGFAFGIGVERLAMMKYRIVDMRWLYENDMRVLGQFRR